MKVTTTIEINSQAEMAQRLERKNSKSQLARALARIWNASNSDDAEVIKKHVEEVMSNAVWGY